MGSPPENPQDSGISLTHPPRPTTLPPPRCQTPRRQAVRTAMFHGTRPGWIEVIAGVMFSGKSEELVRRVRRAVIAKKRVQVFKSHLRSEERRVGKECRSRGSAYHEKEEKYKDMV